MLENAKAQMMSPKFVKSIKVGAVVVGAALAVVAVGAILYKTGMIGNVETAEEIVEAALAA